MDFSQPRVIGEDEESADSGMPAERPPSRHLSGASSPAHYNNNPNGSINSTSISVLQNGSGRLVMHDASEGEPIGVGNNGNTDGTTGEGYLYHTSNPSAPASGRNSGTSAGTGNSIHSTGSGKHNNSNNNNSGTNNNSGADELSTSMPVAGAFTPFGQMSHRKSTQNLSADNTASNTNTTTTSNITSTNPSSTATPPSMEPIKESSTNSLYLSKEHSFVKNNSTTNTTHAPLEKQRSAKGVDCTSTTSFSGSAYVGGGSGNESPSMQRNATTLDLETSLDHEENDKQR